jgi:hypothetical protein
MLAAEMQEAVEEQEGGFPAEVRVEAPPLAPGVRQAEGQVAEVAVETGL